MDFCNRGWQNAEDIPFTLSGRDAPTTNRTKSTYGAVRSKQKD